MVSKITNSKAHWCVFFVFFVLAVCSCRAFASDQSTNNTKDKLMIVEIEDKIPLLLKIFFFEIVLIFFKAEFWSHPSGILAA